MTVITPSTGWPWWRMVQKSGKMRYQRQRRMFAVWRLSVGISPAYTLGLIPLLQSIWQAFYLHSFYIGFTYFYTGSYWSCMIKKSARKSRKHCMAKRYVITWYTAGSWICPASMSKTVVRLLHFRGTNYIADIASPPLPVLWKFSVPHSLVNKIRAPNII